MRRGSKAVALALTTALMLAAGATAAPKVTVKGDARAWAEIGDALAKLSKLKTYRFKITKPDRASTTAEVWDVVNPDRYHMRLTEGGKTSEMILVSDRRT